MHVQVPSRLVVNTVGLYRLRRELGELTGLRISLLSAIPSVRKTDVIGCWGVRPSQARARRRAFRASCPVWQFEDGFLRSVRPGSREQPLSLVVDRTGLYYDARQTSDLETSLSRTGIDEREHGEAERAMALLRSLRLSKYNQGLRTGGKIAGLTPRDDGDRLVVVVDQVKGDASIAGALADDRSFQRLLDAAVAENPQSTIVVRTHPESLSGRRTGYFGNVRSAGRIVVNHESLNPWELLDRKPVVYTVSSLLGFEALIAGCRVSCFGAPFYSGWGLTDDRVDVPRRARQVGLHEIVYKVYLEYVRYFDAWTRRPIDFFRAAEQLAFLRDHYFRWPSPVVVHGVSRWKRPAITAALTGSAGPPVYRRSLRGALKEADRRGAAIAAWGKRAREIADEVSTAGMGFLRIEDGFLRSVGLGAGFVRPLSLAVDDLAHHFDGGKTSRLESLLASASFDEPILARARALRQLIVSHALTKYNLKGAGPPPDWKSKGRACILVPGQVADDESVRLGVPELFASHPMAKGGANLALLERVRARSPSAFIVYRPHPDVSRGLRNGRIPDDQLRGLCDAVAADQSITALFALADRIETMTSLLGFEALIRGIPVTVHGRPFYAGWGLTEDLSPLPRRQRRLCMDELLAGALLLYPVYIHGESGLVCPVEVAVQSLVVQQANSVSWWLRTSRTLGEAFGRFRHQWLSI